MSVQGANPEIWTIAEILRWTTKRFADATFPTPLLDAQLLLGHALQLEKIGLYMQMERPLTVAERSTVRELIKRRLSGEPVAYILQKKYWHNLELFVDKRVLIPRPETETLLDFVLSVLEYSTEKPLTIFDLCTGSGCLGLALAKKYPEAKVVCIDYSEDALNVAKLNAANMNISNIAFVIADLTKQESYVSLKDAYGNPSVIVANPPYLSIEEWEKCEIGVKQFEPKMALLSEKTPISFAQNMMHFITQQKFLENCICFAMELGVNHPKQVTTQTSLNAFAFPCPPWDLPQEQCFALKDLETKERFLCRVKFSPRSIAALT